MSSPTRVADLLAALDPRRSDVDANEAARVLEDVRARLADGVDAVDVDDVDRFAVLAERFGLYADAWNALTLRRRADEVPTPLRGVALRAFLASFLDVARARPEVVVAIARGRGEPIDRDVLVDVLAFWCTRIEARVEATGEPVVGHLVALGQVLDQVGASALPPQDVPSDLVSRYVALSMRLVDALDTPGAAGTGAGPVLARALVWSESLRDAENDVAPDAGGGAPGPAADPSERARDVGTPATDPDDAPHAVPSALEATEAARRRGPSPEPGAVEALFEGRGRIVVIGALAGEWDHLVGVAKSMGVPREALTHVGYDEVKARGLFDVVRATDAGILIGPVPHKVRDGGRHASPVEQAKREMGVPVEALRAKSSSGELKITKSTFREGLAALLREIAVRSNEVRAAAAA